MGNIIFTSLKNICKISFSVTKSHKIESIIILNIRNGIFRVGVKIIPQNISMKYTDLGFKTASVVGVGVSNRPLIRWLLDRNIKVTARDMKPREKLEPLASELERDGVRIVCGDSYLDGITDEAVFRTPGVRYDKPQLRAAVQRGALLTSEMELFFDLCPCRIIGVTGSDGKTTTTTVISELIKRQYGKVWLGGNIGAPLLPRVEEIEEGDWAVVELSSFQLHTMKRSPHIAVITNITPNHLDYHLDMDEYIFAKSNIFRHQRAGDRLVLNAANPVTAAMRSQAKEGVEVIMFGGDAESAGSVRERMIDGSRYICRGYTPVLRAGDIKVPGHHNVENYEAVVAALGGVVDDETIRSFAREFGGVEHRIELVREKDGVRFYNSSIDSSPTRTIAALESFCYDPDLPDGAEPEPRKNMVVIIGGYDKHIPFEPLCGPLCACAKAVVFTGATGQTIKSVVTKSDAFKASPFRIYDEPQFDKAVRKAASAAEPGDIVILSPACASFDAFKNFMERGERFREIILGL